MKIIQIAKLSKYYGFFRGVEDISLDVNEGEIVGFIGPNGAGKSTVIRVLMGLLRKTSGEVLVLGEEPSYKINANIGYLPSEVFLYSELTAQTQLKYFAQIRNVPETRIHELAKELDLDLTRKIGELSFGNKKKVGIIAALMHSPKLIILDEPTSGLDPLIQQSFFQLLENEKNKGASILLSSHVLNEVEKACDRICLIKDGKTIFTDSLKNIKNKEFKKVILTPTIKTLQLPGLKLLSEKGNEVSYSYDGDINDLIRLLSSHRLTSLKIEDLNLEEIFMHYYQKEANHD